MKTYSFSSEWLGQIVDHAANLDIGVTTLTLVDGGYTMTTEQPFNDEQFEHLQSFSDIEEVA